MAAIGLGLLPLVLCEIVLSLGGWPLASRYDDPFVGFHRIAPLFVLNTAGDRYEIPASRQGFFAAQSFTACKSEREYRIFCLGGSTVQGNPWSAPTAFPRWLQLTLQAADPSRSWQVINCGGISYASYRLAPIVEELLQYEPDMFILCTGHNEMLEDRSYETIRTAPRWLIGLHRQLSRLRTYRAARLLAGKLRQGRPLRPASVLPEEVETLLDYRGGLEKFQRDDERTRNVIRHYQYNVSQMVALAQSHNVPIVLVQPVANLKDTPPFKIQPSSNLTNAQRQRFKSLWQRARQADEPAESVALLLEARTIDPRHAGVHFLLGKLYEQMRWPEEARASFLRAKDEDVCPLRMLEPMYDICQHISRRASIPLVDLRPLLQAECDMNILGDEILVDHVHPSIEGYQKIALRLFQELENMGIVAPQAGWEERRKKLFREQLAELDEVYYARGQQHLEGLRLWASGRTNRIRPTAAEGNQGP